VSLTCDQFRELLGDHLGGELVVEVQEKFEVHRSGCEHCGNYLETYTHTVKVTRKLPKCELPKDVEARLRARLRDHLGGASAT
jgi:hypothetical protein